MTSENTELEIELKVVEDNDIIIMKVTPQDDLDIDDLINVEITEEKTSFINNLKMRVNTFEILLVHVSFLQRVDQEHHPLLLLIFSSIDVTHKFNFK